MARDVVLKFTANVTSLRAGMLSAAASVKDFEGQVVQVAKTSNETQRIAGKAMLAVGAAAAAGLALAVRSAVQFEQRMMNVATISSDVEKNFGAAGNAILQMSGDLGVGANELAEGLYDVASSGFQGAAGMEILEVAAVAAQAGLSTTAVAAQAITGALNAYGLSVSQASDVSDIFFQTVNLGIVTFEELAQNVGDFMGTANALGVALDQASAGFATITLAGVPAAEASTSLNAVMTQMIKPASEISATFQALGYESSEAAVQSLGLGGALQLVRTSLGEDKAAFAALFPEVRAMRGALALTAQDGATYARVAGEITDKNKRAGSAAAALAIQQKSLGGQLKIAKEQIVALGIGIGQSLLPVLRPLVTLVQNVTAGFAAFGGGAQTTAAIIGVIGAAVLTLGGGFLLLAPKIAAAVTWFNTLRVTAPALAGALKTVTMAMGLVGIAMVVATGVLMAYGNKKRQATERTDDLVQALKDEREGIEGTIDAKIASKIADEGLAAIGHKLGISTETIVRAMRGEKSALDEIIAVSRSDLTLKELRHAGYFKLREAVGLFAGDLEKANEKLAIEDSVLRATTAAAGGAAAGIDALGAATFDATGYTEGLNDAQKKVLSSLSAMVDLSEIYVDGMKDVEDAEKDANRARAEGVRDGARAQADAMDSRHRAERAALDAETITGKASQAAHDQRVKNLDSQQDKEKEAMETTVDTEGKRADSIENANTRATLSLQSYMKLITAAGKVRLRRQTNLAVIKARGAPEDVIAELQELPAEYAGVIDEIATSSDAGFDEFVRTATESSAEVVAATQAQFDLLPPALKVIGGLAGDEMVKELIRKFREGLVTVKEIIAVESRLVSEQMVSDAEMIPTGAPGEFRPRGGGVVANVDLRAEGHVAQIAPAGSWRVWAEPETGGEAYIPLGLSKRGRSTALVAQVARQFGYGLVAMAEGGTWGVPASRGGSGSASAAMDFDRLARVLERSAKRGPVKVDAIFNEKVDAMHVARRIAWAVG